VVKLNEKRERKRPMKKILLFVAMSIILCGCEYYYVEDGVLRDTLFSVEETNNGYWRIWLTHDDIAGYCTDDVALGKRALSLLKEHDGEVLVEFKDIPPGDDMYDWWNRSDCGTIYSGGGSSHIFMLIDVTPVPSR
jgi:hypothetical protein